MDGQIMQLWGISSISKGRKHTAVVQETSMKKAIALYCETFAGIAEHIATIQACELRLNRCDDYGQIVPGAASMPSSSHAAFKGIHE